MKILDRPCPASWAELRQKVQALVVHGGNHSVAREMIRTFKHGKLVLPSERKVPAKPTDRLVTSY